MTCDRRGKGFFPALPVTGNALRHDLAAYCIRKTNSSPSGRPSFESRNHHKDLRHFRKYEPHYNRFPPFRQQICDIFSNLKGPERVLLCVRNKLFFPAFFA